MRTVPFVLALAALAITARAADQPKAVPEATSKALLAQYAAAEQSQETYQTAFRKALDRICEADDPCKIAFDNFQGQVKSFQSTLDAAEKATGGKVSLDPKAGTVTVSPKAEK